MKWLTIAFPLIRITAAGWQVFVKEPPTIADSITDDYSMRLALLLVCLTALASQLLAGSVSEGGTCVVANDKLDASSHKFNSDCDDQTYCSISSNPTSQDASLNATSSNTQPSGTCVKRKCRKDEFPFGYSTNEALPPLCDHGTACPDNGSACQPLLQVGSTCEMDRDYQCASYRDGLSLSSGLNYNGSVCLQSTCMYANVTIGLPCILERTTYNGLDHNYLPYNITVQRDNCVTSYPRLYCGSNSSLCERMKELGDPCDDDRECLSLSCSEINVCTVPPGGSLKVKLWQYALTASSSLLVIVAVCTFLALSHKRHRMERYYEVMEYYRDQTSLRASIASLHAAAAQRQAKHENYHGL